MENFKPTMKNRQLVCRWPVVGCQFSLGGGLSVVGFPFLILAG
jgi:hypothetical protein